MNPAVKIDKGRIKCGENLRANRNRLKLTITKGQLASLLGTIPETLSRILGRMSGEGLISLKGPHIRILDRDGLKTLADSSGRL